MASWAATDDFEAGSDEALTDYGGGSNWVASQNWGVALKGGSYADFKVDTTAVKVGSRAVHVDCSSASAYIQRNHVTSAQNVGNIYFAVRAAQTNRNFYIYFASAAGSGIGSIRFGSDGNVSHYNNAGYNSLGSYSADTWYYVNFEWDDVNQQNNTRARFGETSWGSYSGWSNTSTVIENIIGFQFEHAAASGADFWVDDVRIDDPFASSGPANLKTWNGLAKASVKSINGLAIASIKNIDGLS